MQSIESTKYGLALHTSSPELGVAIADFAGNSRSQSWNLGRDLSTHLHQYLADFIVPQTWTDLAFIAVAKGPGSFTGTRIGVVTARTLAQQLDVPLFAISSLACMVLSEEDKRNSADSSVVGAIALQMPAQRGQIFAAIYEVTSANAGIIQILPDTVLTPEAWQQTLNNLRIPYKLIDIPAGSGLGASVSHLLELAYLDWQQGKRPNWSEALPYYGQHPVDK